LRTLGQPATSLLDQILAQGREQGVFRDDVDALDVHIVISSYCVFQVANRYTFGYLFDIDFTEQQTHAHLRRMLGDVVVGWLTSR
jgi:Tetracyclin repressor-like, C-terminal domain